ncbi:response regulator [Thiohalomonas denitrificans]|uniref:response regulator n=1 Tax=Thiohalomonas denitrificans TaxID=415747 RepID=UPI0026EF13AB|nr:response regulator [Thiohalomonas denitrificans]
MKLLIAEDNDLIQALNGALMARWGYDYDLVADGAEAIEYARRHGPEYDLCIMDVQMPRVDGLEATRVIRREVDYFPILGYSSDDWMERACLSSGMDAFLAKTGEPDRLRSAIDELTPKSLLVDWESDRITLKRAKPMTPEELRELQELKKNGLTKLKLIGLDQAFIVHKNIQNKISHDFVAEGKEISEFIDRSPTEPGRCHLYRANLYVTKDLFLPEELEEAINSENEMAVKFNSAVEKPKDE